MEAGVYPDKGYLCQMCDERVGDVVVLWAKLGTKGL